ncbi:MAG: hypothetical protein HGA86_06920, partial [Anaerolineaceae bacterium]|nr:hypothetical protein [Anaerolineaceae bacterium]
MTQISWQTGTAFDLFVSLFVLQHPTDFGLRPSWAAGVRSRLPGPQRDFLDNAQAFLPVPISWLINLPEHQKDAAGVIEA